MQIGVNRWTENQGCCSEIQLPKPILKMDLSEPLDQVISITEDSEEPQTSIEVRDFIQDVIDLTV
jgi:hypothetical protein